MSHIIYVFARKPLIASTRPTVCRCQRQAANACASAHFHIQSEARTLDPVFLRPRGHFRLPNAMGAVSQSDRQARPALRNAE